jgi:hypothetical protein
VKALVEEVVQLIVMEPESVSVDQKKDRSGTVYNVRVAPNDVGRLIGKDGRVITCVRHLVSAAAAKAKQRASVKVITD